MKPTNEITRHDFKEVGLNLKQVAEILRVHYNSVLYSLKNETPTTGRMRVLLTERRKLAGVRK